MAFNGLLGVLLEVMRILKTQGIKTSAPIGIPKSSDSASKEAASKSKNGGNSHQWRASFSLEAVSDATRQHWLAASLGHDRP
jgi:hypothetical protein